MIDYYLFECLPDTLAEALDVIRAVPEEERKHLPRLKESADFMKEILKELND